MYAAPAVDELRRTVDAITALAVEHQGPDSHELFEAVRKPLPAGRPGGMPDDKGTPARDHQDNEAFEPTKEAVSDQGGETAPPGADKPDAGEANSGVHEDA